MKMIMIMIRLQEWYGRGGIMMESPTGSHKDSKPLLLHNVKRIRKKGRIKMLQKLPLVDM
jgi:hypothetical protein